ncbi:hypothetical protein, partial [Nostoc sp.]
NKNKPFVRKAAMLILPRGLWSNEDYVSTGYVKGVGVRDSAALELRDHIDLVARQACSKLFLQENFPGSDAP